MAARTYPSTEGGRSCGCDPKAKHVCESHSRYFDISEAVFEGDGSDSVIVSGPDSAGKFTIASKYHGAAPHYIVVDRFVAEDIVYELSRRLAERA